MDDQEQEEFLAETLTKLSRDEVIGYYEQALAWFKTQDAVEYNTVFQPINEELKLGKDAPVLFSLEELIRSTEKLLENEKAKLKRQNSNDKC